MIDISQYKITIENPKGSYKSFGAEGDPVWNSYPLKGVTYPVDYGCIDGYLGEDDAELDVFIGTGDKSGYIKVWRLDVLEETKFFFNLTAEEIQKVSEAFQSVLVESKILDEKECTEAIEKFRAK